MSHDIRVVSFGWVTVDPLPDQDKAFSFHVVPEWDIYEHSLDDNGNCPCNPHLDEECDGLMYSHYSFDGREDYLEGNRLLN